MVVAALSSIRAAANGHCSNRQAAGNFKFGGNPNSRDAVIVKVSVD